MNCEMCDKSATKKVRVEPKVDPRLGQKYIVCETCADDLKRRYDNRSDRQVFVENV
jgi:protein-arginine kinase activator protein McsA